MNGESIRGLISAYLLDGEGGGRQVSWPEVDTWSPDKGLLWLHFDARSEDSKRWLETESGLDEIACDVLMAEDVRPRCFQLNDGLILILRGVNLNPKADPEDMVSIRTWIDTRRIITTQRRNVLSISDIRGMIAEHRGPGDSGEFIILLADRLVIRMADVIEEVNENAAVIEDEVFTEEPRKLREDLATVRRQCIALRRYLAPQSEVLRQLQADKIPLLDENGRRLLREVMDRTLHYIEELDAVKNGALVTQEILNSHLSEQLERRMYILATIAAIFLPLTFVTGLLGINVAGIPGAESHWGFLGVTGTLALIVTGQLFFFKKKRWI